MAQENGTALLEWEEVRQRVDALKDNVSRMAEYVKIGERRERLAALEELQASADFWNNQAKARETIAATNAERAYVVPYDALSKTVEDASVMLELAGAEDGEARQAALKDTIAECEKADAFFAKLRMQSLLGGKFDQCNVFILAIPIDDVQIILLHYNRIRSYKIGIYIKYTVSILSKTCCKMLWTLMSELIIYDR